MDWIYAAKWGNYRIHDFFALDGDVQSLIVEAYHHEKQIEGVLAEEQRKKMKSQAHKGKSGAPRR